MDFSFSPELQDPHRPLTLPDNHSLKLLLEPSKKFTPMLELFRFCLITITNFSVLQFYVIELKESEMETSHSFKKTFYKCKSEKCGLQFYSPSLSQYLILSKFIASFPPNMTLLYVGIKQN